MPNSPARAASSLAEWDTAWIVDCYVNANPPHLGLDWSLTDETYGPNKSHGR
jgi:hypothetical protein